MSWGNLLHANDSCTVIVRSEPNNGGIVIGGGRYEIGSQTRIEAQSNSGYRFKGWSDGSGVNPRKLLLSKDTIYTALFEKQVQYVPQNSASIRISYDDSKVVRDTAYVTISPNTQKKKSHRR